MKSSQRAFDKIIEYEVSNKETYERRFVRPEWPGASSGATIGIGYDLGQTPAATVQADWGPRVSAGTLAAMLSTCGRTGEAGRAAAAEIRGRVLIPWDLAIAVHKECVVPRWEARVLRALPNSSELPGDCFGALLSLSFNRGTSYSSPGPRYEEMRGIRDAVASKQFTKVPGLLRSMKRLWPNLRGLRDRRDDEAQLFADGLKAWRPALTPMVEAPAKLLARPDPINLGDEDATEVITPEVAKDVPPEPKPLAKSKTIWGGISQYLMTGGAAVLAFLQGLPPWLIAAILVGGAVSLYLVIKGRIDVQKVLKQLVPEEADA